MTNKKPTSALTSALQPWKIWLGVLIGLSVTAWMLWDALQSEHFIYVGEGKGTYNWYDQNANGSADLSNSNEFRKEASGNYAIEDNFAVLRTVNWTSTIPFYIFLALGVSIGRDIFYVLRIRLLTNKLLSFRRSAIVIFLWEFASALSPGIVGGSAVAMFILHKEKVDLGRSTAIVFITTMMDNLFYVVLIPIVFLISGNSLHGKDGFSIPEVETIFWTGYLLMCFFSVLLFTAVFLWPKGMINLLNRIANLKWLKKWRLKITATGSEILLASEHFKSASFWFWVKVAATTVGSWTCRFITVNILVTGFLHLGLSEQLVLFQKQLVMWLFLIVTPTPGGSGIAEYIFTQLVTGLDDSLFIISFLAIIWRLITYYPYLIIGSTLLPKWIKRH